MGLLNFLFGKNVQSVEEKDEAAEILSKVRDQINRNSYFTIPDKLEPMINNTVIEQPIKPELWVSIALKTKKYFVVDFVCSIYHCDN